MTDSRVLLVAGSPTASSRSQRVLEEVESRLKAAGLATRAYSVREFPPEALLLANANAPLVEEFLIEARRASAVVFATPVYKAVYTGALKVLIDLIPPDALTGKAALAIATARQPAHLESVRRAFEGLFAFFQVGTVVAPVLLEDAEVVVNAGELTLTSDARAAIDNAAAALRAAILASGSPA